ncbi:uncharacterized protein LOC144652228 isoform X2 [Oculina patagonica]
MDRLEELYFLAFNCNCFEEVYKRRVFDMLGDFKQTLTWDRENGGIDSILLALTVVQKLYQRLETVNCPYLKIITDNLVSKICLVDGLLKYLDHRDQHVVFSATKAIVLVFQTLPKQMIKEQWFQTLFSFGQETEQRWRKLYTMELLSKILTNSREPLKNRNKNSQQQMNNKKCFCTHEADCMIGISVSSTELVDLFLGSFNLQHVLFQYIPFIVRPNGMYSFMRSCQHAGAAEDFLVLQASVKLADAIHDQENVKREAISGTKESKLVAFLHCVALIAKYLEVNGTLQNTSTADVKTCSQDENYLKSTAQPYGGKFTDSICANKMTIIHLKDATVNQLCTVMATLIQYLHYPRLPSRVFKKILEVLNQIVVIPSSFMLSQKNKSGKLEKIVRSSSISFLSVVECCLLHRIPRCSGFVGFSGTEIKSSSKSTDNEHSVTDLVALRKASLMVFKSSFVVLKSAMKQEGSLLFQKLSLSCISLWCSGILSLTCDGHSNIKSIKASSIEKEFHACLVTLFVDQDDDLVEVMLLLLLLYQEINRTVSSCSELSAAILHQLNPHLLFIAFAESIKFDHSLLLDLLISSETRFLEYIVQYLHFVNNGWNSFVQCLAEYKGRISFSEEQAASDDLKTCSVHHSEFESDSNSVEKPSEFERRFFNEINSRENYKFFTEQKNLIAEEDVCLETPIEGVSDGTMLETSPEVCQPDFRVGNLSGERNGLRSIVLAYCSSDESDVEIEEESKIASYHETPARTQSDCISCSSVCFTNNNLGSSPLDKAYSTETFHSPFTNKTCSAFLPDISEMPREHTEYLNNPVIGHSSFFSNQPTSPPGLNIDGYLGGAQSSSLNEKVLRSSDEETKTCITKGSQAKESLGNRTELESEILDTAMTMLIRLRLSVVRLSSGGHFPYSAAPLITLMEKVENFYDGC